MTTQLREDRLLWLLVSKVWESTAQGGLVTCDRHGYQSRRLRAHIFRCKHKAKTEEGREREREGGWEREEEGEEESKGERRGEKKGEEGRERKRENQGERETGGSRFLILQPALSGALPPQRLYCLNLPKQCQDWEPSIQRPRLWDTFPPQSTLWALQALGCIVMQSTFSPTSKTPWSFTVSTLKVQSLF